MPHNEPEFSFLLGLPFHRTTMEETLAECDRVMAEGVPAYMVTANADFVAQAYEDPDLRRILFFARRVVCDGMPLVWLSRLFRIPLPERITGSDMVFHLFEHCNRDHRKVFFLGSDERTLVQVASILGETYPHMEIAGWLSPPIAPVHEWPNEEIISRLKASQPDLLLVAVGCPKQERWILQNFRETGVPLSIGIGASLDFISGKQVRSPKWMQRWGLEWLWRIYTDPKRLAKRYMKDLYYLILLTGKQAAIVWARPKRGKAAPDSLPSVANPDSQQTDIGCVELVWTGSLQRDNLEPFILSDEPDRPVFCDVSGISFMDSAGIGQLVKLVRKCQAARVPCAFLANADSPLPRLVKSLRMESVLNVFLDKAAAHAWIRERLSPDVQRTHASLTLSGQVDAETFSRFESEIQAAIENLRAGDILRLDCQKLEFIDSYAVGRLIAGKRQALAKGNDLFLVDPSPQVMKLLRLFRLEALFLES